MRKEKEGRSEGKVARWFGGSWGNAMRRLRTSKYDKSLYLLSQLRGFSLVHSEKREKS